MMRMHRPTSRLLVRRGPRRARRGTIYVAVLGASTLIVLMGVASLMVNRSVQQTAKLTADATQARHNGQSGVDLAMLIIDQNPGTWRDLYKGGSLPNGLPLSYGSVTVVAIDPDDADLTDGRVQLTATGLAGEAIYKLQVTLDSTGVPEPGSWRRVVN